jgi:hypothetical protein
LEALYRFIQGKLDVLFLDLLVIGDFRRIRQRCRESTEGLRQLRYCPVRMTTMIKRSL